MTEHNFNAKMLYFKQCPQQIHSKWSPYKTSEDKLFRLCPYDWTHRLKISNDSLQSRWIQHLQNCRKQYHQGLLKTQALDDYLGPIVYCPLQHPVRAKQYMNHRANCEFVNFDNYVTLELLSDMKKYRDIVEKLKLLNSKKPEPSWRNCLSSPPPNYISNEETWD